MVGDKEYPLDILIFSTGFRAPGIGSPGYRAGMTITGRDGKDMDTKWQHGGASTLHGCMTHGFPNFFMRGPFQAGATDNQNFTHDIMNNHIAQIIAQAQARHTGAAKVVIEPTRAAKEAWTREILKTAMGPAALAGCTPGYLTGEGIVDQLSLPEKMKAATWGLWGEGIESFMHVLEAWERDGKLEGLEVTPVG